MLKSNYQTIISNSMVIKMSKIEILKYFKNGNLFNKKALYFLAKLGFERTRKNEISEFLFEEKYKFLYVIGSRKIMKKTFDFIVSNKINYSFFENCGHYPMLEKSSKVLKIIKKTR